MPDPDLEIRGGGGGGAPNPLNRGGGGLPPKIFWPFGPHFGLRIKGGQPPGSFPWIRRYIMTLGSLLLVLISVWWCMG